MVKIGNKASNNTGFGPGCSCCGGNHGNMPGGHDPVQGGHDQLGGRHGRVPGGVTRREFLQVTGTSALGAVVLPGLSWSALASVQPAERFEIRRRPLVVQPVLTHEVPERREQTSWRNWGGLETEEDADREVVRIRGELDVLRSAADFPVDFLPVEKVKAAGDLDNVGGLQRADLIVVYAAGGGSGIFDALHETGKDIIFFCRHKSGPVYLWYEIISPRYLRRHTDEHSIPGIGFDDVVIDSHDEMLWRLRSLCGLKNTLNTNIIAIGGAAAWSQPADVIGKHVSGKYKFNIHEFSYDDLGKLITEAMADETTVSRARSRAADYLSDSGVSLETNREFVDNCFVLEDVFKRLMEKFNCRAITINHCMGTIMPLSRTAACLTLGLLNDAGYLAFCESDFVVVPAGILMANISGKPVFFCNPTYPHDGIKTISHCTAPRRMDGKNLEPARILTHFESDYGAAPKVEMKIGQTITNIIPDFSFKKYIGLPGRIVENPFMPICRTQVNISYDCDDLLLAEKMPGFHWITVYGDYLKESGYALKKIGIEQENLV